MVKRSATSASSEAATLAQKTRVGKGQRVVRGRILDAEYVPSDNPRYAGNPCIEALPAWLNVEDPYKRMTLLIQQTTSQPSNSDLILGRSKGALTRLDLLYDNRRFFELLPQHLSLELLVRGALYESLVARNPLDRRFTDSIWNESSGTSQQLSKMPDPVIKGLGFFLGGGTGSGKTTAVERIAQLYPQVIRHQRYNDKRLILTQVVWLLVETPKDGSPLTVLKNIFVELDDILGTTYTLELVDRAQDKTYAGLKNRLRQTLANHNVGMLVLDEVQHFFTGRQKNQSDAELMSMLVELVNTLNVPIILIGTYKAHALFKHDARHGRRNVGCPPWEYMEYDEVIETEHGLQVPPQWAENGFLQFIQALWRIQYVRVETPLTKELYDEFFKVTQGIADVACKLFLLAQARIIASGADTDPEMIRAGKAVITSDLLKDVYQEAFHLLHPALSVLRIYREQKAKAGSDRNQEALEKARLSLLELGDVIFPEDYIEAKMLTAQQLLTSVDSLRDLKAKALSSSDLNSVLLKGLESAGIDPMLALECVFRVRQQHKQEEDVAVLLAYACGEAEQRLVKTSTKSRPVQDKREIRPKPALRLLEIVRQGEQGGISPIQALSNAGITLNLNSLIEGNL